MGGRFTGLGAAVLVLLTLSSGIAAAQEYPNRPITWVVTGMAGSVTDIGARTYAKVLAEKLGQQFVIDNKPGAGGIIGTETVARVSTAPADRLGRIHRSTKSCRSIRSRTSSRSMGCQTRQ